MADLITLLVTDSRLNVTCDTAEHLTFARSDILVDEPLEHWLLTAEYGFHLISVLCEDNQPDAQVMRGIVDSAPWLTGLPTEQSRHIIAWDIARACTSSVVGKLRVARSAFSSGIEPRVGNGTLPREVFESEFLLAWLGETNPINAKVDVLLNIAELANAICSITFASALLDIHPDTRKARDLAYIIGRISEGLITTIRTLPQSLVLLSRSSISNAERALHQIEERYLGELRASTSEKNPVFLDPYTAVTTSALSLIASTWKFIANDTKSTAVVASLKTHKELLRRNNDAPYGRRLLSRAQLQDLVTCPTETARWPIGIPEVEAIIREVVHVALATGKLPTTACWEWCATASLDDGTILIRVPLEDIYTTRTNDIAYLSLFDQAQKAYPLLAWMLCPSTLESSATPTSTFSNSKWDEVMAILEKLVDDEKSAKTFRSIRRTTLVAATGGGAAEVAAELFPHLMPEEIAQHLPMFAAAFGSVVNAWVERFLRREE